MRVSTSGLVGRDLVSAGCSRRTAQVCIAGANFTCYNAGTRVVRRACVQRQMRLGRQGLCLLSSLVRGSVSVGLVGDRIVCIWNVGVGSNEGLITGLLHFMVARRLGFGRVAFHQCGHGENDTRVAILLLWRPHLIVLRMPFHLAPIY